MSSSEKNVTVTPLVPHGPMFVDGTKGLDGVDPVVEQSSHHTKKSINESLEEANGSNSGKGPKKAEEEEEGGYWDDRGPYWQPEPEATPTLTPEERAERAKNAKQRREEFEAKYGSRDTD